MRKKIKHSYSQSLEYIALDTSKQEEQEKLNKKAKKELEEFESDSFGVIYLSNIPHGFYEKEMNGYFSQFGKVLKVKLARNSKNGRSKGFAFIKFAQEEVAKIAAETMNNYLMFDHCLKCECLDTKNVPKDAFKPNLITEWPEDADENYWKFLNKPLSAEQMERRQIRLKKYLDNLQTQYKELEIDYDWGDLKTDPEFLTPKKEIPKKNSDEVELDDDYISIYEKLEKWVQDFDFYHSEKGDCLIKEGQVNKKIKPRRRRTNYAKKRQATVAVKSAKILLPKVKKNKSPSSKSSSVINQLKKSLNETPEMIVDLNDDEISFKTPPTVRVKKRAFKSPPSLEQTPKQNHSFKKVSSVKRRRLENLLKLRQLLETTT